MGLIPLFDNTKKLVDKQIRVDRKSGVIPLLTAKALNLMFDVIAELLGMSVIPLGAADCLGLGQGPGFLGNREWQRRDGLPIPLTAETGHGHKHHSFQHQHQHCPQLG